jgi:hypothetical protein
MLHEKERCHDPEGGEQLRLPARKQREVHPILQGIGARR